MKFSKGLLAVATTAALTACGGGGGSGGGTIGGGTAGTAAFCNQDFTMSEPVNGVVTIGGRLCNDLTLSASNDYVVDRTIIVGGGDGILDAAGVQQVLNSRVTLTIEAGTDLGFASQASLIVTRGGMINANGTNTAPISMTSSQDDDIDGNGEWGGIVIQGFAPQVSTARVACNLPAGAICNVQGEGGDEIGNYGGNLVGDNSGILRYVRVAEGGIPSAQVASEINGITLQGVGSGTTLEFLQVHGNLDDGFEWFGGTVNAKYLVATNNQDDSIDFDEGYVGNMQHVLVIKQQGATTLNGAGNNGTGIEANSGGALSVPQTMASLANFTIISGEASLANAPGAVDLRGDVTINMTNSVIDNHNFCVEADDGLNNATSLTFTNVLCDSIMGFGDENDPLNPNPAGTPGDSTVTTLNNSGDVDGTGFMASSTLNFGTVANGGSGITFSPTFAVNEPVAMTGSSLPPVVGGSNFTFDITDYAGAVDPAAVLGVNDGMPGGVWWAGWTFPGTVDVTTLGSIPPNPNFGNIDN